MMQKLEVRGSLDRPQLCKEPRSASVSRSLFAIVYGSNAPDALAGKCTMCVDRLEQGLLPVSVSACTMRALDFGTMAQLKTKYPDAVSSLSQMPDGSGVQPSLLIRPHDSAKRQLVHSIQQRSSQ